MLDLQEMLIIAQLIDNMQISIGHLEKAYSKKDNVYFEDSKKEILDIYNKIAKIIK